MILTGNLDTMSEDQLRERMEKILDDNKVLLGESTELPSPSSKSQPEEKHSDQKKPHPSHHTN